MEKSLSWVTVINDNGHPDDALLDVIALENLREKWERARDSVSGALAALKNEPTPLASTRPRSVIKRWMMNIPCFS